MSFKLPDKRRIFFSAAFLAFFCLAVFSAAQIALGWMEYSASSKEYEGLRQLYEPPDADEEGAETDPGATPGTDPGTDTEDPPVASGPPRDPAEVNPDYIGWLKIRNTWISYPLVQGSDNDKYVYTSFEGYYNRLGAIFMDYRCAGDFDAYHTIIYGHNMRNGTMFSSLDRFLDSGYLDSHREIVITAPDGQSTTWQIFAARKSDIRDFSYRLSFDRPSHFAAFAGKLGAPEGVSRILTLSTCTSGAKEERILVHAYTEEPVVKETTPEDPVPEDATPEDTVPETAAPEDQIPWTPLPETTAPENSIPETTPPENQVPEITPPENPTPETTPPENQVPETTPEDQVPETIPPENPAPETTTPENPAPETTPPENPVPETTPPENPVPETTSPENPAPETTPPENPIPEDE